MTKLYTKSWKNCLDRFKQLGRDLSCSKDRRDKKPVTGSGVADKSNTFPTNPDDAGNDAGTGPSFV